MVHEWKPHTPPTPPEPPPAAAPTGPHRWRPYFRGMPVQTPDGPGPFGIPYELADDFATHIEAAGFVHVDDVRALLAAAGFPDLPGLPHQTRHQRPPEHGQDTWTNPPRWIDDEEETA